MTKDSEMNGRRLSSYLISSSFLRGGIAPRILNLNTSWRSVVNFTPRSLYPGESNLGSRCIGGWVGSRAGPYSVAKRKNQFRTPTKNRTPIVCLWRWRQHGPPKRWYPTTTLHSVTTWRWRQHGPPKRWYPTTTLHSVTTWRWRQHGPPKRWYPTTTPHDVTNHKTRLEPSPLWTPHIS
jgi:hypothetical protein